MRLPVFNPREIPSDSFNEDSGLPAWPDRQITREDLMRALAHPVQGVTEHLLRRDTLLTEAELRPAAVLILLLESEQGFDVVLTVRAAHLRHHAGQVSFVGGQVEVGETMERAALREAYEEIGVQPDDIDVLGELPVYHTITGFAVTPVVACMSEQAWHEQNLDIAVDEVDHVFTVPLSHVLDVANTRVHYYTWEERTRQYYSVTFGDYFIWGASMAMLRNLDVLLRHANA